jgi:site-specific DNA recombinase
MSFKIATYIRVSTEEQAMRTEGSLESQKHRLNGFVDIKNMQQTSWGTVIESYIDEGLSAKDTKRPALQRMLRDLKNGRVDMVLVTDISRLSRSIRDFCDLIDIFKDTKTQFLSLKEQFDTTTAAGEMML